MFTSAKGFVTLTVMGNISKVIQNHLNEEA